MSSPNSLSARILSGSLWSVLGEVLAGGARALSYVVYARLLSPTDFGLLGFALLLLSLFPLLIDNSLGLALTRHPEEDQHTFSVIFFLNLGLTLLAMLLLALFARWMADFVHDRRAATVIPVLSIQLLFNSLCSVHLALARRRFQYRRLVPIRLISTLVSLVFGIWLALLGYAYWALVLGAIAGALTQMLAAWVLIRWHPSFEFDWQTVRSLFAFTSWVALDMAITWMVMSGGGFFLAFFLGAADLGLFRLSDQVNTYIFGAILNPLIPVLYSGFCEVAANPGESQRLFGQSVRAVALIAMIATATVVIAAHPLEILVGAKWRGIGIILALNAIADGVSYAILPTPSFLRAHGRAKVVAAMRIIMVLGQVVIYSAVAARGLQAFVLGKLCLELSMYLMSYAVLRRLFAAPALRLMGAQAVQALVVALCATIGLVAAAGAGAAGAPVALCVGLLAFAIPLGLYLFTQERQLLMQLLRSRQL